MKYIKKVHLENFQSHKNTTIEFDRSLNIIVGASDSGKTSILRGIKWALYNDPSGDYFIREGESECSVTIFFSDKTKIKRYRSKSKNTYFIYDKDDNETKYEGFGTSVPNEILNTTGIKKILLDKDTSKAINISDQLEGAFLLSEKNSIKANSIGYLVGVDILDDALRDTLKDNRNLSNQQKNLGEDINKLKEDLSEYNYLEEMNKKIKAMNEIRTKIKDKTRNLDIYRKVLNIKTSIDNEKQKLKYTLDNLKYLYKVELDIKDFELNYNRLELLLNHKENFEKVKINIEYNFNFLTSLANIDKLDFSVNEINIFQTKQSNLYKLNRKLEKHIADKKETADKVRKLSILNTIMPNISKIESNISKLVCLDNLKSKENKISNSLDIGKKYLKKLEDVSLSNDIFNTLNKKTKYLDELTRLKSVNTDIANKKDNWNASLTKSQQTVLNLSNKYKETLLAQKTCPLCFSEIDNEKADHIINQYK